MSGFDRGSAQRPASMRTGPSGPASSPAQSRVSGAPTIHAQAQPPRPEGAGTAASNSNDFTPEDIRWMEGRDPERNWAITRQQPVASLLVAGLIWGFCRNTAPPRELIGRRLIITAGSGHEPFKNADASGWDAVARYCGQKISPAEIPSGRKRLFAEAVKTLPPAQTVGSARLVAAYKVHRVIRGALRADVSPTRGYAAPPMMGRWQDFEGKHLPMVETFAIGSWVWCFEEPYEFDLEAREPIKGFGGIWDFVKGLELRGAL